MLPNLRGIEPAINANWEPTKLKPYVINEQSYTGQLVWAFINDFISEKQDAGWYKRRDGLLEDCTGSVFTVDLKVSDEEVKVYLKPANIINFS